MQDKDLDKIIGEKLGNLDIPYRSGSWDALEQRLDNANATEKFDEAMRRKLSDIDMSYQPMYWDLLAHRLEQEAALRNQLIRYKTIEVLLVFLLLITFVQFFPNQSRNHIASELLNTVENQTLNTDRDVEQQKNAVSSLVPPISSNKTTVASSNSNTSFVALLALSRNELKNIEKLSLPNTILAQNEQILVIKNRLAASSNSAPSLEAIETINSSKDIALLEIIDNTKPLIYPSTPKKNKRFRVGIFANANVDNVQTPYDEIFDLQPNSQIAHNYGGGLLLSLEWKKWELETGLAFNNKQYKPADNSAVRYGNIVEDLTNIELNILQIPLQLRYDVMQKERWHVYALSGATIHLATQANYDVAKVYAPSISVNINNNTNTQQDLKLNNKQQALFEEHSVKSDPESEKLNRKKFPDGLFSGGSYKDNSYYTANLGLGVERYFDDKFSVFVQPTYRQNLNFLSKGLGPNEDRISTLELMIGLKFGF